MSKGKSGNRPHRGFKIADSDLPQHNKQNLLTPTGDRRHMPQIREGKMSAEVFAKDTNKRVYPPFSSNVPVEALR